MLIENIFLSYCDSHKSSKCMGKDMTFLEYSSMQLKTAMTFMFFISGLKLLTTTVFHIASVTMERLTNTGH